MTGRWIERAGWVVFGLAAVFAIFAFTSRGVGSDLNVYVEAARAITADRSPYLPADAPVCRTAGCFLYPPPVALLFVPLLALPPAVATWTVVVLLTLLAAAVGATLVAPLSRTLRPWAATSLALFFPLLLDLNLGNVNLLTVGLALAAWASRDRPVRGGALLALAVGLKLLAATLVVFYVVAGRWRQLGWAAATAMLITIATAPWVGSYWQEYVPIVTWQSTGDVGGIRPDALQGALGHAVSAVATIALAVAAGVAARRSSHDAGDLHALALAVAPLVAHGIYYTFLVMTLPLLAAVTRALAQRPALLILPALAWLAMEMPLGLESWRFLGFVATIALGAALFLPRALAPAR